MSETFDYIVIGAGSAGCVLANRLTEDAQTTVCIVEAGPRDRNPLIHIPLGVAGLIRHPRLNWLYSTVPQQHAGNRRISIPAGRVLGGSSSINGMVYMRGHPRDYDDWAEAGNSGWSYRDVLPYFIRSEDNEVWRSSPFHGTGGELRVSDLRSFNDVSRTFVTAALSLQFRFCDDFSGPDPEGFGYRQVTQRRGRRESVARAFYNRAASRPNLNLLLNQIARRVIIEDGRAVGVEIEQHGQTRRLNARNEVIVSAGAIGSPAILMRSGIGDGERLRGYGIETIRHSPDVGRNLQEHAAISIQYRTDHTGPYGISWKVLPRLVWSGLDYILFRRGLLASNALEAAGFIRTQPGLDRPDIQYTFMAGSKSPNGRVGMGHGFGASIILLRPKSRGEITLMPADPAAHPQIDPQFFKERADVDALMRGFRLARRIFEAPAFRDYAGEELQPGTGVDNDESLETYIRNSSATAFHPVGTCRMGRDEASVVDAELRLRGIKGLRVVDASIMPTIVAGNTNAPTIMIAEKAADMIRGRQPLPAYEGDLG
ncbi:MULTISPECIES: GMC family oxidoreductase N-terminal domain-containing protein [unclassified Chelatococcus]|uniref:GMC family oxidoreductase n=1 Tax=unclassified Chelatococcus TaxID=2638111 RepID=UPI001BCF3AB2|nr:MULTISPECIES: GMC family oxidoreductase N-terminal domain-containing protein [unclassified Chelatococcus]MBS7697452.1 GMC family oxidoreductase N-terminal domain-containing protein [Chelatococcus sp. YT9]MBX3559237.1 GMC family oxidoreductase N-terminal domain-containing protein [Chelatococcus sp.]